MKKFLPVIIVLLILIGGGAAVLLTKDDSKNNNATSANNNNQTKTTGVFDALATTGTSFIATITSTNNGKSVESKMEYDQKNDAVRYTTAVGGSEASYIFINDAYYICQSASKCFKYPASQGNSSGFDRKAYEYSNEELAGFKNTSVDGGEGACPAGTCHIWKVANGGYESSVYIDTKTKRISQVESTSAAGTSKITYEYKDVTVTAPKNAQELPQV